MEFILDPSREQSNIVMTGVQHKYDETLLVLTTNKCINYCDYCFRKRIFIREDEVCTDYNSLSSYIDNHNEITNILLTGGDPLSLPIEQLTKIINIVCSKGKKVRIGTRALTYQPELLRKIIPLIQDRHISLIAHINEASELNYKSLPVINELESKGIDIRSQTVLLNNVNNNPESLIRLFRRLVKFNIFPYYLFQCRPVVGNEKYIIQIKEGIKIVNKTRKHLSGLEKSFRYIISADIGKIELIGFVGEKLICRLHQSKDRSLINKIYSVDISDEDFWLDWSILEKNKEEVNDAS